LGKKLKLLMIIDPWFDLSIEWPTDNDTTECYAFTAQNGARQTISHVSATFRQC